jgi:spore coat polysaccharide biosynthesis protein SpsF
MVMRCDAAATIGFGHASRCLAIADAARMGNWDVLFAMSADIEGVALVKKRGYRVVTHSAANEAQWLRELVWSEDAAALVLDIRTDLAASAVEEIHARGATVVVIDDGSERRMKADLVFYPPVPQLKRVKWDGFGGQVHAGWEWIPLRPEITAARLRFGARRSEVPTVMVTMGASDPAGLTLRVLEAFEFVTEPCKVVVLAGPAFLHRESLAAFFRTARDKYELVTNAPDIAEVAASADMAVASFGVTAYELAALGVPALHMSLTADHAESASALETIGASRSLGVHDRLKPEDIALAITDLLRQPGKRAEMARRGADAIDGKGAQRIADCITELSQRRHVVA